MREQREFPTFREWLGGPIAEELTDDELERFRAESFSGARYDLHKAWCELMGVTALPLAAAMRDGFFGVWRAIGRLFGRVR